MCVVCFLYMENNLFIPLTWVFVSCCLFTNCVIYVSWNLRSSVSFNNYTHTHIHTYTHTHTHTHTYIYILGQRRYGERIFSFPIHETAKTVSKRNDRFLPYPINSTHRINSPYTLIDISTKHRQITDMFNLSLTVWQKIIFTIIIQRQKSVPRALFKNHAAILCNIQGFAIHNGNMNVALLRCFFPL
jgi:hypothetical protein